MASDDAARFVADTRSIARFLTAEDGAVAKDLARRALKVERMAKRLCPVDTGRLRSSIAWRLDKDAVGLSVQIGTNVDYAAAVEFGTLRQHPQPYLRPALEAAR